MVRILVVLATLGTAMVVASGSSPALAQASGVDAGQVVVVDPVNTDRELTEFDANAAFRLRLPDDATCPGDSANDDYRVQTFLLPIDTDLSSLTYRQLSPDGDDRYRALRYTDGDISTQEMTNQNPGPNQPAAILSPMLPFTFAWYRPGSVLPGRWKIGVACTPVPGWNVEKYWDAEIELVDAPEIEPVALRIRVIPADSDEVLASSSGDDSPVFPLAIGFVAVLGVIILVRKRSNSSPARERESL